MKKREIKGAGKLRRKAEERLKLKPALPKKLTELETKKLIEELQIHQIELEIQNEELRRIQAVIEESRAKYSDLYDFAPVGYFTLNRQGLILEANLTACSSLGIERGLLINIKNLFSNFIIKKEGKDLFYQHLGKVFEAKSLETCELELKVKGDTKFYARLESIVVKDNLSQCRTAITDITEHKRLEDKLLHANESNFKNIFDNAGDGILLANLENKKFYMGNNAICQILGYSPEEIKNLGVMDIHPEKDIPYVIDQFERQAKGEFLLSRDLPIKRKDGSVFYADVNGTIVTIAGKKYLMGMFHDLTARKQEEEVLRLKKINELKTEFVATVSHELRTPLSVIKEGITLVLDKTAGGINEKQEQLLSVSKANIDRLARIIDELLDISKIESGEVVLKKELVNLDEIIKMVESTFKPKIKERGIELRIIISEKGIEIYADKDKLTQIFSNLINNALNFTKKGYIEIKINPVRDRTHPDVHRDAISNGVEFSVADTGIGISKEDMPKVFSKFQQFGRIPGSGDKGTGLGLSIVKELVELHKGKIWIESKIGKGTRFVFILPKKEDI